MMEEFVDDMVNYFVAFDLVPDGRVVHRDVLREDWGISDVQLFNVIHNDVDDGVAHNSVHDPMIGLDDWEKFWKINAMR